MVELVRTPCVTACDLLCSSGQYLTVQWSNFYWILVGKMLHRNKIKWCQSNKATPVVETYAAQLTCELCSRWEIYMHDTATCWAVTVFYSSSKIDQLMCMNLLFILIPFLLKNGTDQRTVTLQQKLRGLKISKISFSSAFLVSQGICLVYSAERSLHICTVLFTFFFLLNWSFFHTKVDCFGVRHWVLIVPDRVWYVITLACLFFFLYPTRGILVLVPVLDQKKLENVLAQGSKSPHGQSVCAGTLLTLKLHEKNCNCCKWITQKINN